ncbi:hypothetical protein [Fluctibacter corallii]|nr:hypothetical protein [Aestuariibacter sp. AA17]
MKHILLHNMKIGAVLVALLIINTISGCLNFQTEIKDLNQFVFEEYSYYSDSPLAMHGSTGGAGGEICSKTTDLCIGSKDNLNVYFGRDEFDEKNSVAVVTTSAPRVEYFLDLRRGTLLKCNNCKEESFNQSGIVFNEGFSTGSFAWSNDKQHLIFELNILSAEISADILFHYEENGVTWTEIDASGGEGEKGQRMHTRFAPDSSKLGWIYCDTLCDLVVYDVAEQGYTRTPTGCENGKFLELTWENAQPIVVQKFSSRGNYEEEQTCKDETGEYKVPILFRHDLYEERLKQKAAEQSGQIDK